LVDGPGLAVKWISPGSLRSLGFFLIHFARASSAHETKKALSLRDKALIIKCPGLDFPIVIGINFSSSYCCPSANKKSRCIRNGFLSPSVPRTGLGV
jgi:hypothetical protein